MRWVPAIALALVIGACGGGGQTEEDRVAKAVEQYVQAYRDKDARTLCSKLFPSTDLPPSLSRKLGVAEGRPGKPSGWQRDYRECSRTYGKHGEFKQVAGMPEVERVVLGSQLKRADGISRTARVTARLRGRKQRRSTQLPMV